MKTAPAVIFLVLLLVLLSGCASIKGVDINDEERAACIRDTCSVWTPFEIKELVLRAARRGYEIGKASI